MPRSDRSSSAVPTLPRVQSSSSSLTGHGRNGGGHSSKTGGGGQRVNSARRAPSVAGSVTTVRSAGGGRGGYAGAGTGPQSMPQHQGQGNAPPPAPTASVTEILAGRRLRVVNEPREIALQARLSDVQDSLTYALRQLRLLYQTKYVMRDALAGVDDLLAGENHTELGVDPIPDVRAALARSDRPFARFMAEVTDLRGTDGEEEDQQQQQQVGGGANGSNAAGSDPYGGAAVFSASLKALDQAFTRLRRKAFLSEEVIRKLYARCDGLSRENTRLKAAATQAGSAVGAERRRALMEQQQAGANNNNNNNNVSNNANATGPGAGVSQDSEHRRRGSTRDRRASSNGGGGVNGDEDEPDPAYQPHDPGEPIGTDVDTLQTQLLNARKEIRALRSRVRLLQNEKEAIHSAGLETWATYTPHLLERAGDADIELVSQLKTKLDSAKFTIRALTAKNELLTERVDDLSTASRAGAGDHVESLRDYIALHDLMVHKLADALQVVHRQLFGAQQRNGEEVRDSGVTQSPQVLAQALLARRGADLTDVIRSRLRQLETDSAPVGGNAARAVYGVDMDDRPLVARYRTIARELSPDAQRELLSLLSEIHYRFHLLQKEKAALSKVGRELRTGSSRKVQRLLVERCVMRDALQAMWNERSVRRKANSTGGADNGSTNAGENSPGGGGEADPEAARRREELDRRIYELLQATANLGGTGDTPLKPVADDGGGGGDDNNGDNDSNGDDNATTATTTQNTQQQQKPQQSQEEEKNPHDQDHDQDQGKKEQQPAENGGGGGTGEIVYKDEGGDGGPSRAESASDWYRDNPGAAEGADDQGDKKGGAGDSGDTQPQKPTEDADGGGEEEKQKPEEAAKEEEETGGENPSQGEKQVDQVEEGKEEKQVQQHDHHHHHHHQEQEHVEHVTTTTVTTTSTTVTTVQELETGEKDPIDPRGRASSAQEWDETDEGIYGGAPEPVPEEK